MKNIIYSTTRQWNPGDEFILLGCINIITEIIGQHNVIIYNRNPDIRNNDAICFTINKRTNYMLSLYDNSIKNNTDCSYIDLVVFAGTPEWGNENCVLLYDKIIKNNIPTIYLGLGSLIYLNKDILDVLYKSSFVSLRWKPTHNTQQLNFKNFYILPCPAMQCVKLGEEKKIQKLKKIGLVFIISEKLGTICNCVSHEAYIKIIELYKNIINSYKGIYEITIICHYIDEIKYANDIFNSENILIRYSYDSKDYISIYKDCDVIISPRVHGCGLASSLGIPSISITHDERGDTTKMFLSQNISIQNLDRCEEKLRYIILNIYKYNRIIIKYKKRTFNLYIKIISKKISFNKIRYNYLKYDERIFINEQYKTIKKIYSTRRRLKYYMYLFFEKFCTHEKVKTFFIEKKNKYKF